MIDLTQYQLLYLAILITVLYFISRATTNAIFAFLRSIFKRDQMVFAIVSIFFLPGTVLHELAHFFMATVLLMKVREIKILPEWEKNYIKLGRVLYEKRDFVSGVVVGIAPIGAGLLFFWWLAEFKIFPSSNWWLNLPIGYLVFSVSSTMFSSKQDLINLIYIFPVLFRFFLMMYVFNIKLDWVLVNDRWQAVNQLFSLINYYLLLSVVFNAALIIFLKILKKTKL